jgi:signal transduction histidine kinase/ActR/RegA family two-component response regulator
LLFSILKQFETVESLYYVGRQALRPPHLAAEVPVAKSSDSLRIESFNFPELLSQEGGLCHMPDILEKKPTSILEIQLNSELSLRQRAQRLARLGSWRFNLETQELQRSKEVYDITGLPFGSTQSLDEVIKNFDKDDISSITRAFKFCIEDRKPGMAELRMTTKDKLRYLLVHFEGEFDEVGCATHIVGAVQDITDLRRVEEESRKFEAQVRQSQKLESLGVLAGGIAHDFNNLLMGILGNADLALLDLAPESPARQSIFAIETAAKRAADLARQMLAYSGKGRFVIKRLDLRKLIEEMMHLLKTSVSKKAVLKFEFADNVPPIEADAAQIRQIVLNLVINASEAIGEKSGVIFIRTGALDCDADYLKDTYLENSAPAEGTYSYIEISDTGGGMDKDTLSKIFDPFFTTKFTGRGLGLAAVLGIVRGHRAAVKVYSELKKGTTFKVLFPSNKGPVSDTDGLSSLQVDNRLQGKLVMLVDDEETVRTVGQSMLERLGCRAVTAEDGRIALAIFRKNPSEFDCVILDLTMPHMDGEECFRELRRIRKDITVVLSSGYNEQDLLDRFAGKGLAGFIQKPYKTDKLRTKLLEALTRFSDGG